MNSKLTKFSKNESLLSVQNNSKIRLIISVYSVDRMWSAIRIDGQLRKQYLAVMYFVHKKNIIRCPLIIRCINFSTTDN